MSAASGISGALVYGVCSGFSFFMRSARRGARCARENLDAPHGVYRQLLNIGQMGSYGDNPETPLHLGYRAIAPGRFLVWSAQSLPSITRHCETSVCRINAVSWSTSPS